MLRKSPTALAAALAIACGPADRAAQVDAAGYPIDVGGSVHRIVSLSPSLTELLFAIGAGDRVVGRTRWCTEPAAALDVPNVGDGLEPNLEAIVARQPDLVVFYHSPSNAPAIERLRGLGIGTVSVQMDRLEDVGEAALLLAAVVGAAPHAAELAQAYRTRLDAGWPTRSDGSAPSVLMLAWDAPPIVIGGGSYLSQMVEAAGGRNVFADLAAPSATVSIEAITARDPDVVLFTGDAGPTIADRPEWQAVPAVRDRRFVRVSGTKFSWPSFRSTDAIGEIAAALAQVEQ